jgi:hypothetical protein
MEDSRGSLARGTMHHFAGEDKAAETTSEQQPARIQEE